MSGARKQSADAKASKPPLTAAQQKWAASFCGVELKANGHDGSPAAPGAPGSGDVAAAGGGPGPLEPIPAAAPAAGMKAEEIAAEIMDKQQAALEGWRTALTNFDKVMTSSADAEATPKFQKTVVAYFQTKLLGWLQDQAFDFPGGKDLKAIIGAVEAEAKRAQAAGASAKLRDFVVQHVTAVGKLIQAVLAQKQGFVSAVRAQREALEAPTAGGGAKRHKKGKSPLVDATKGQEEHAMMRVALMDMLDRVDGVLKASSPEAAFRVLSEEWVRNSTVGVGLGHKIAAVVVIRLNKNYSVLDARIQGSGGGKLAEQLLKDSPDGVELLSLKAPKNILLMADNGFPSVTLKLDANNRDISDANFASGDTGSLYRVVMKGLPPTKMLRGD